MLEPSRSAEPIRGVLGDFEGVVMCDAYGAYGSLAKGSEGRMRLAHCLACYGTAELIASSPASRIAGGEGEIRRLRAPAKGL